MMMSSCSEIGVCGKIAVCPIRQGDTAVFCYALVDGCGDPVDLTGLSLHFTMRVDYKQECPDLQHTLNFWDLNVHDVDPATHPEVDSKLLAANFDRIAYIDPRNGLRRFKYDFETGKGKMRLSPQETSKLRAGQCYFFAFQLRGKPGDVYTVNHGKVSVEPNLGPKI